ncbi:MAG: ATP-binding protein [Sphingomonadaceae bacterium]
MSLFSRPTTPDAQRQLASLPLAFVLLEPGHTISAANPAAEQFFGKSARKLTGTPLSDALTFTDTHTESLLRETDTPVSAREIDVIVSGQHKHRIDLTASPVADMPGWQVLVLNDHRNIDEFGGDSGASGEQALRGPEILAHEIKNPLAGIKGAAQLLGRKVGDAERPLTELITSEVDRIASLIEQMQVLSGQTAAPVEPCNLHLIIRKAIAVLGAASGDFRVREEFDPSLPDVLGNADGLVQVIINLFANAREASSTVEEPLIAVRTRFASGLQLYSSNTEAPVRLPVEIRVSDNGPGVPAELRDHLFEPFVTSKKTGQGLGLALVRKIVRDMNGRISHERDETEGLTHFRVYLPLANSETTGAGDAK